MYHKKNPHTQQSNSHSKWAYVIYDDNGLIHALANSPEIARAIIEQDIRGGNLDLENAKIEEYRLYSSFKEI